MLRQLKVGNEIDQQVVKLVHRVPLKSQYLKGVFLVDGVVVEHGCLLELIVRFQIGIIDYLLQLGVTHFFTVRLLLLLILLQIIIINHSCRVSDTFYR